MPWVAGADARIPEPGLLESRRHIQAEILLDVGLRALQQRGHQGGEPLQHRGCGVLVHHHKNATGAQQPGRFLQHRMGGLLRQLMANKLQADQVD